MNFKNWGTYITVFFVINDINISYFQLREGIENYKLDTGAKK